MGGFGSNTISSPQRKMVEVSLKKRGLGAPTISGSGANFCTVTDNGVGDYSIVLKSSSGCIGPQIPEVQLTAVTAAGMVRASAVTISSVRVLGFDVDGVTAKEMDFDIAIKCCLASDLIGP